MHAYQVLNNNISDTEGQQQHTCKLNAFLSEGMQPSEICVYASDLALILSSLFVLFLHCSHSAQA